MAYLGGPLVAMALPGGDHNVRVDYWYAVSCWHGDHQMALNHRDEAVLVYPPDDPCSDVAAHHFFDDHLDRVVDDRRDDRRDRVARPPVDDPQGVVVGGLDDPWDREHPHLCDDHRDGVADGPSVDHLEIVVGRPVVLGPRNVAVDPLLGACRPWMVGSRPVDVPIMDVDRLVDDDDHGWNDAFVPRNRENRAGLVDTPGRGWRIVA